VSRNREADMRRGFQELQVYGIQDRRASGKPRPWIVRWSVDGQQRSKSFRTKSEGERFRSLLLQAIHDGEAFDATTGEPASWQAPLGDTNVYEWARRWLGEQWVEWQPRTRKSAVESLAKLVMLAVDQPVGKDEAELRHFLTDALPPGADSRGGRWEKWIRDHSILLSKIDRHIVAEIDRQLGLRLDGQPLAATTANRTRIVCRACILAAVVAGAIAGDPWPKRTRTRARRKVARRREIELRRLPDPAVFCEAIDAIASHQPGSENYRVMTAVAFHAGLRPSEVVMLRVGALDLPLAGWGHIHVVEADISFDEPGEPKTGHRVVPIAPELVEMLRQWIIDRKLGDDRQLLFRTSRGSRPSQSNWARSWHRALRSIGQPPLRVYDCRHAAATGWLQSGISPEKIAIRLGHSVETLLRVYVGNFDGNEAADNAKIEAFMKTRREEHERRQR
jgi:integrase